MGSEQNEGTSFQPSEPKLCVNNCGFFGNAATMNLCSKCYRDYRMKEEQAESAKVAVEKSLNLTTTTTTSDQQKKGEKGLFTAGPSSSSDVSAAAAFKFGFVGVDREEAAEQPPPPPKAANRCSNCNKKVGLTGFQCKCGSTFCGMHRYPEKHDCSFDFKSIGRDAIAKANPVVKADKVERF